MVLFSLTWTELFSTRPRHCFCMQVEIYEDKDSARKDEIAALGGQTTSGTNVFSAFYDRLKEVISNISLYLCLSILELIHVFHMNVNK